MTSNKPPFEFIDLFAGIGGFAAALQGFGGKPVYSVEIDAKAAKIYEQNWGHSPLGDITIDANEVTMNVPRHDILAAGFPCQPFSKSGAQKGMEETRGTLYWNILRIIQAHHPTLVILENVRNLAGPRHKHEWDVIIETLRFEGYSVSSIPAVFSPHLIPRSAGGRPQIRERVFITATYDPKSLAITNSPNAPITHKAVGGWNPQNWDLTRDLPLEKSKTIPGTELSSQEEMWIEAWDDWVKTYIRLTDGQRPPGFPIWVDAWVDESALSIEEETPSWKVDFLIKNSRLYTKHKRDFDSWVTKWGVSTSAFPPSRRKLEWQAQDAQSLWDTVMHFRPSGIRAKKPTYLPALVAITQTSIIGPLRRRLSTREAARLQGLPDTFTFSGQTDAATYKQLGNGVNVGAIWFVLKQHVLRDEKILNSTAEGKAIFRAISNAPEDPDLVLERFKNNNIGRGN